MQRKKKEMLFRCAPFDEIFVLFLFLESVKNKKKSRQMIACRIDFHFVG